MTYAGVLRRRFAGKPIIPDSNLLLLLIVGTFQPSLVRGFKRLDAFVNSDLRILQDFTRGFQIATSSHVLTEVSNLANSLPQPIKSTLYPYFALQIRKMIELQIMASELVNKPEFSLFGLTDSVLTALAGSHLLLTNDERLAGYLRSARNLPVLTLKDLRAVTTKH